MNKSVNVNNVVVIVVIINRIVVYLFVFEGFVARYSAWHTVAIELNVERSYTVFALDSC